MERVYLTPLGYEIGDITAIEEVQDWSDLTAELQLLKTIGHAKCSIFSGSYNDFFRRQLDNLLKSSPTLASDVDMIITTIPVNNLGLGSILQESGFNTVPVMEVGGGQCASTLVALNTAAVYVSSGIYRTVLFLTCDISSGDGNKSMFSGIIVAGDGASAALVSSVPGDYEVLSHELKSNWAMSFGENQERKLVVIETNKILEDEVERKGSLASDDNVHFVTLNSILGASFMKSITNLPLREPYSTNFSRVGHTINSDYLINLKDFTDNGECASGEKVVIGGRGTNAIGYIILRKC